MSTIQILRLPKLRQRGNGWGNIWSRLRTFLRPILSSVVEKAKPIGKDMLKRVGEQSIKTGADILSDVAKGAPVGDTIKSRVKQGVSEGKEQVVDSFKKGIKRQTGGKKRHTTSRQVGKGRKKNLSKKKNKKISKKKSKYIFPIV